MRFLSYIYITLSFLVVLGGCDDELPSLPPPPGELVVQRDMAMMIELADQGPMMVEPDQNIPVVDMMSPVDERCNEGEIRLKADCGYLRCYQGVWSEPASPLETCNNHDDDCDNQVDENFGIGEMCSVQSEDGVCYQPGTFACDLEREEAVCLPLPNQSTDEICDGIDNDCDGNVDEGFPATPICCTESLHCPPGSLCMDGTCDGVVGEPPMTPGETITPTTGDGTCNAPIPMNAFGIYSIEHARTANNQNAFACTGNSDSDLVIWGGTLLGNEAVFSFTPTQTQRVRLGAEFSAFDSVIYVRTSCANDASQLICNESTNEIIGGMNSHAEVVFEAQANQTYYVTLDTTFNLVEVLESLEGQEILDIPFVLTYFPE